MTTLAYYSTIIKKEELLDRLADDISEAANSANDLVCHLKVASSSSKSKNVADLLAALASAQELIPAISALVENLNSNAVGYVKTLVPQDKEEAKQEEETKRVLTEEKVKPEAEQLSSLVDAIKSLREMQDSLEK